MAGARLLAAAAVCLGALPTARGERRVLLPLPGGGPVTALNSSEGWALLEGAGSRARRAATTVGMHFTTQANGAFCSVATTVTLLNALAPQGVPAPVDPLHAPFAYWTQSSLVAQPCLRATPSHVAGEYMSGPFIATHGVTLEEWAAYASCFATVEARFAEEATAEDLRAALRVALGGEGEPTSYVAVNFHRPEVAELGGGHMSPIGAWNEEADAALLFDVSRYKYSPVWVDVDVLFSALTKTDSASGRSRGWITASAPTSTPAVASERHVADWTERRACILSMTDESDWLALLRCMEGDVSGGPGGGGGGGGGGGVRPATVAVLCLGSALAGAAGVVLALKVHERVSSQNKYVPTFDDGDFSSDI